jgi:hypothetical protein
MDADDEYYRDGDRDQDSKVHRKRLVFDDAEIEILDEIEELDFNSSVDPELPLSDPSDLNPAEVYTRRSESSHTNSNNSVSSYSSIDSAVEYSSEDDEKDEKESSGAESDEDAPTEYTTESDEEKEESAGSEGSDEGSDEGSREGNEIYAYIKDYPVQMICLEKCAGTFDELFVKNKMTPENGASALFQVIMSLLAFKKAFKFTHNDLHTNNIMYIETKTEHLYYKYAGIMYRVPTHGRIFKIIDFGRGIYQFRGKLFCSDSFASNGDAATQYNCEPYFNEKKPRLEPNYSFDLCRLGCSIYDFIMDEDVDNDVRKMDDLQRTVHRWCTDDNGKNVLYRKSGVERYPNFKLYKMIARTVSKHTPEAQLDDAFFKQFLVSNPKKLDASTKIFDIDALPMYV